jgi:hypothetical protein
MNAEMAGRLEDAQTALEYIFAGRATFTLVSLATGSRLTFQMVKADPKPGQDVAPFFARLLVGSDNESDYRYIALVRRGGDRWIVSLNKTGWGAEAARALDWAVNALDEGRALKQAEVWHTGHCGRCGRLLTVPESVRSGIGPTCASRMD